MYLKHSKPPHGEVLSISPLALTEYLRVGEYLFHVILGAAPQPIREGSHRGAHSLSLVPRPVKAAVGAAGSPAVQLSRLHGASIVAAEDGRRAAG